MSGPRRRADTLARQSWSAAQGRDDFPAVVARIRWTDHCRLAPSKQVSESLLAYYDAERTTVLVRGFGPLQGTVYYGRGLIPILRAEAAASSVPV